MLGTVFSEIFPAYIFIAGFSVFAVKRAAFIAQKFNFIFLILRECIKFIIQLIQPEIRNNIPKITPLCFLYKLSKISLDLCSRGNKIKGGIIIFNMLKQKIRVDYNTVLYTFASCEKLTQFIAFPVGEMFRF